MFRVQHISHAPKDREITVGKMGFVTCRAEFNEHGQWQIVGRFKMNKVGAKITAYRSDGLPAAVSYEPDFYMERV